METKEIIQNAYIDYVLTHNKKPASVYVFAKDNAMSEDDFYKYYGNFDGIETDIWTNFFEKTITEIKLQEVWQNYSAREKALSFFYSFFELLKTKRSFVVYSMQNFGKSPLTPQVLKQAKQLFETLSIQIIQEGLESNELAERKFFSDKYKNALWLQLMFVLKFWQKDSSAGFEKTDEAIEKGVNVTFDLFQRSPIDNLFDYGKFLTQNAFK
ncbi:MAG: TetR/AcrR family transcriptional regulator [Sphingobacteriales bacterium]|nr:MAG: TetR/AcrR family transcriptional regulator [Sphingobacteriales bacterium]TAF78784.1 MAG: TetR/AcrR family transcriptional regulator [Sphingobacteriales bacterium]